MKTPRNVYNPGVLAVLLGCVVQAVLIPANAGAKNSAFPVFHEVPNPGVNRQVQAPAARQKVKGAVALRADKKRERSLSQARPQSQSADTGQCGRGFQDSAAAVACRRSQAGKPKVSARSSRSARPARSSRASRQHVSSSARQQRHFDCQQTDSFDMDVSGNLRRSKGRAGCR